MSVIGARSARAPAAAPFPPGRLFIDGAWRESSDGARRDVLSPATGEVIASVAVGTTVDVDAAVAAARRSFDSGVWSRISGRERARVLQRAHDLIRERAEELAQVESADAGKPITFARVVDVEHAALQYEYAASLGHHLDGSVRETPANTHAYVRREPVGVVAAITPFNLPLILASTKIAPALVAGNSIVHEPASETPLSSLLIEILQEAGVPDGVFNVVTGPGAALGERHRVRARLGHPDHEPREGAPSRGAAGGGHHLGRRLGPARPSVPFSGVKRSGWGREHGPEVLASYQRTKSIVFSLDEAPAR